MPPQQRLRCLHVPLSQNPASSWQQSSLPEAQEALPQPVLQDVISTQTRQGGVYGQRSARTNEGKIMLKPMADRAIPRTKQQDKMRFFIGRILPFGRLYHCYSADTTFA